ncbi:MAG: FUSC family protein [Butyricicoccus sp.]
MQFIKRFRVGQRAIKTAISVGLALALAMVLGSSLPIFAAIGAISVMSRTWVDSLKESLNQIAGTFLGYLIACVFVTVLPNPTFFVWMALGVLCVISLCIGLKRILRFRWRALCLRMCACIPAEIQLCTASTDLPIHWSVWSWRCSSMW